MKKIVEQLAGIQPNTEFTFTSVNSMWYGDDHLIKMELKDSTIILNGVINYVPSVVVLYETMEYEVDAYKVEIDENDDSKPITGTYKGYLSVMKRLKNGENLLKFKQSK